MNEFSNALMSLISRSDRYVFYFMCVLSITTVVFRFIFLKKSIGKNNVRELFHITDLNSFRSILNDGRLKSALFGVVFTTANVGRLWQARRMVEPCMFVFSGACLKLFKKNVIKNKLLPFIYPYDIGKLRADEYQTVSFGELVINKFHIDGSIVYVDEAEIIKYQPSVVLIKIVAKTLMSLTKYVLPGFVLATVFLAIDRFSGIHVYRQSCVFIYASIFLMPLPQFLISECILLRHRMRERTKNT